MAEGHAPSSAQAAQALLDVTVHIEEELNRTRWSQWGTLQPRLQDLADGKSSGPSGDYDLISVVQDIIVVPSWSKYLARGHSDSYVREFEALVKESRKTIQEYVEAAISEIAKQPIGDQISSLERRALAEGKMQIAPDQVHRVLALLLQDVSAPPRSMAGEPHPLLQMGMTYASRPTNGPPNPDAAGGNVLDGALEGSKPVRYDMATLLNGAPGTAVSGLGYRLVTTLDTIAPTGLDVAEASASKPNADEPKASELEGEPADYYRKDAPGFLQPIAASWPLDQMMEGPREELTRYNKLAGIALDVEGFRLRNKEDIIAGIEHEGHEVLARRGRELHQLDRVAPDLVVTEGATKIAAERARDARDEIEMRSLGGMPYDIAGEVALTTIIDRERLGRLLTSAMRHYAPGASGQAAAAQARADLLAEEEASVKLGALLHMN